MTNKKIISLSLILVLAVSVTVFTLRRASTFPDNPEFCARCHSMEAAFNSWTAISCKNSECLDCHAHGRNRPSLLAVEMKDNNCTTSKCHPINNLIEKKTVNTDLSNPPDDLRFNQELSNNITQERVWSLFNHKTHLVNFGDNLDLQCTACHSYLGGKKHFEINKNTCNVCHFADLDLGVSDLKDPESTIQNPVGSWQNPVGSWQLAVGSYQLAVGKNQLAVGSWQLAILTPQLLNSSIPQSKIQNPKSKIQNLKSNCLLCHQEIKEKIVIYDREFDHAGYKKNNNTRCTDCHFGVVDTKGDIVKDSCTICHARVKDDYKTALDMHYDHAVEHKVACSPCHQPIAHKGSDEFALVASFLQQPNRMAFLSGIGDSAHLQTKNNEFLAQNEIVRGTGSIGVDVSPDPMYLATVNCTACHKDARYFNVSHDVCGNCHVKGFEKVLAEQQEFVSQRLEALNDLLNLAKNSEKDAHAFRGFDSNQSAQDHNIPASLIRECQYNYDLVKADGSLGAHNIKYVRDILDYSISRLQTVLKSDLLENQRYVKW